MRYFLIIAVILISSLSVFADPNAPQGNPPVAAELGSQSGGFFFKLSDLAPKRTAFVRMEKNAQLSIDITNDTGRDLSDVVVKTKCSGNEIKNIDLSKFQNKEIKTINIPVDTTVRSGKYIYAVSAAVDGVDIKGGTEYELTLVIVNRKLPYQMPVMLWEGPPDSNFTLVKNIGFTNFGTAMLDKLKVWNAKSPTVASSVADLDKTSSLLDKALVEDIGIFAQIEPHSYMPELSAYYRIDRNGKNYEHHADGKTNLCGNFEDIQKYYYNCGVSVAQTYGVFPSFVGAQINTEIRDQTNFCFHPHDLEAYKAYSGKGIPQNVESKYGVNYKTFENFPVNHIIPDNDVILDYLAWFWQKGDGWGNLSTLVHKGLKSTGRNDLLTYFDPAIRVPSISGSGGEVDAIENWTYAYPDPIKIGKSADELFAMASLSKAPQQGVLKMTQAIWYRSMTAPKDDGVDKSASWEQKTPDADFITVAPDSLREAFWCEIARNVRGVMYHGLASLTELTKEQSFGYVYTNPETPKVLKELSDKIVKPLGPTLLQIPEINSDVAFLQSFASEMYAGVGEYGWGWGWENDAYEMLSYAHIQPKVIYDEHILKGVLKDVKVLVLVKCPILTETVANKINEFQRNGGLIVGDENLYPGISPDILINSYTRPGKDASVEKEQIQEKAREFRKEFDRYYVRYADSSNDDVLVRIRRYQGTDYVFTVNDNRMFGDYVGHHKLVMEKGLPSDAVVSLNREQGYVYDLKANKEVLPSLKQKTLEFPVNLGPGDGSIFMVTSRKIDSIKLDVPDHARPGSNIEINISILDDKSSPLKAVIPCHVEITAADGKISEFSGYYGVKDGTLKIKYDIANNDPAGEWKVAVKELASGIQKSQSFDVK